MPKKYKGESEDALKIKKKKLVPFGRPLGPKAKWGEGVPPVRHGLKNPNNHLDMMLKRLQMQLKEEAEKERKRNEKYKKRAKRQDRMS